MELIFSPTEYNSVTIKKFIDLYKNVPNAKVNISLTTEEPEEEIKMESSKCLERYDLEVGLIEKYIHHRNWTLSHEHMTEMDEISRIALKLNLNFHVCMVFKYKVSTSLCKLINTNTYSNVIHEWIIRNIISGKDISYVFAIPPEKIKIILDKYSNTKSKKLKFDPDLIEFYIHSENWTLLDYHLTQLDRLSIITVEENKNLYDHIGSLNPQLNRLIDKNTYKKIIHEWIIRSVISGKCIPCVIDITPENIKTIQNKYSNLKNNKNKKSKFNPVDLRISCFPENWKLNDGDMIEMNIITEQAEQNNISLETWINDNRCYLSSSLKKKYNSNGIQPLYHEWLVRSFMNGDITK